MKKLFSVGLIVLAVSGCALHLPNGSVVQIPAPPLSQVAVTVTVINNCAPVIDLESTYGVIPGAVGIPYSGSRTVRLESTAFSGPFRTVFLTVKGYSADRTVYVGSITRQFTVNTYEGSTAVPWTIKVLHLPGRPNRCL